VSDAIFIQKLVDDQLLDVVLVGFPTPFDR
jgi:hypothetical protein